MVIITLLVAAFLASYYYVWPVYVLPLVEKTQSIGKSISLFYLTLP